VFNANGQYAHQGASYQQHVINIVNSVHSAFNTAEPGADYAWGNSVAWFCDGVKQLPWTIRAESYIKKVGPSAPLNSTTGFVQPSAALVATPGETISWAHDLRVQSANLDRRVYWTLRGTGFPDNFRQMGQSWSGPTTLVHSNVAPPVANGTLFVRLGSYSGGNASYTVRTVAQDDVGNNLCQRIEWQPYAWNNTSAGATTYRCVNVPYNYTLTPVIKTPSDGQIVFGDKGSIAVQGEITASGPTKSHTGIDYQITQLEYAANVNPPQKGGGPSGNNACSFFTGEQSCQSLNSGVEATGFNYNQTKTYTATGNRDEKPTGTKICFAISVKRNSSASTQWQHSALSCQIVGKQPKVQVHGGNVQVGRGFTGSIRQSNVATSTTMMRSIRIPPSETDLAAAARATQRYWVFGNRIRLDFGVSTQLCPGGGTCAPSSGSISSGTSIAGNEGTTVATDKNGVLQFYTDGLNVHHANGSIMSNGTNIGSTSTTTQAAAVFPIAHNRYAIVTSSAASEYNTLGNLRFTIVDMTVTGPTGQRGGIIKKNQPFGPTGSAHLVGEGMAVAPNAAGDSYWVVTNIPGTREVRAFSVPYTWDGNNGTSLPYVASSPGTLDSGSKPAAGHAPGFGTINFNSNYSRAVIAMQTGPTGAKSGTIRVLNFNSATGSFTPAFEWTNGDYYMYSADFSPNGDYVYATTLYNPPGANAGNGHLYRYTLAGASSSAAVRSSEWGIAHGATGMPACGTSGGGGQVKRGSDGRMYVARINCSSIGVIGNPDAAASTASAIGWRASGQALASGTQSQFGLPQTVAIVRAYLEDPPTYAARTFGSFSEYSIFAPASITGMASRSGLNGGVANNNQSAWSALSYTDIDGTNTGNSYGSYSTTRQTLPNVEAAFPRVSTTPAVTGSQSPMALSGTDPTSVAAGGRIVTASGPLTVTGGQLNKGRWAVINAPTADITISGNISYEDTSLTRVSDIPQLIIIARNITINSNVTNVDAWLIAKNTLSTCNQQGTAPQLSAITRKTDYTNGTAYALTSATCNQQLRINGPVIADKLFLRRTHGSEIADPGNPAEIINLRPDAYLWAQNRMTNKKIYRTSQVVEVPPRY
jgi:hypothetical protein